MALPTHDNLLVEARAILRRLGVTTGVTHGNLAVRSPITGGEIARVQEHTPEQVRQTIGRAHEAFLSWRTVPPPVRGGLVRELGDLLREHKDDLGALVSIE